MEGKKYIVWLLSNYIVMTGIRMKFFDRVLKSSRVSTEDLEALSKVRVAIIGLGGVGSNVAYSLVRNGFINFKLVDPEVVNYSDVYRSSLFGSGDAGLYKVEVVRRELKKVYPNVDVTIYPMMLTDFNIDRILKDVDIIVDATDNVFSKALINRYSVEEGVPTVYTAVRDNSGRILFLEPGETGCFECIHPNVEEINDGFIDGYGFQSMYLLVSSYVSEGVTHYFLGGEPSFYGGLLMIDPGVNIRFRPVDMNPSCNVCSAEGSIDYPDIDYQYFMKGNTFIYTSDEKVRLDIERLSREIAKNYILLRRGDVGIYFEYMKGVNVAVSYAGTVVVEGVKDFEEGVNITRRLVEGIFYKYVVD